MRPQNKFPWGRLHKQNPINGKIHWNRYSKCWAFFNIFIFRFEKFAYRGPTFVPCVLEVCRLGLEPLWHSSPPLCHSENTESEQIGISSGVRKDGNHWARGPGIGWMMNKHLPAKLLQEIVDLSKLTMNFDRRYALCIDNFIIDSTLQSAGTGIRAAIFNHCVMRRHYSIMYTQSLHAISGLIAVWRMGKLLCGRPSFMRFWGPQLLM